MLALALQIPAIQRRRVRVGLVLKFLLLSRLSNTRKTSQHIGTQASAWMLLESDVLCLRLFVNFKTLGDAAAAPVA